MQQYNEQKANNGKFAGPRVYVVGKGTVAPQAGDEVIVNNKSMRVEKVYPNGSFDAE